MRSKEKGEGGSEKQREGVRSREGEYKSEMQVEKGRERSNEKE